MIKLAVSDRKLAEKAINSLIHHCETDPKLSQDKDIQVIINTGKRMGIPRDYIPRIIPLSSCKMYKPKDLKILLITKDAGGLYRDNLMKDDISNELFKEIISVKNLKRRFKGSKLKGLYKEFDLVVADYRVHHLLPGVLGNKFFHGNKKTPFMIRMSKAVKVRRQKMEEECDPVYVRAQLRSICKNTSYIPNNDNCLNVKIGELGRHSVDEMIQNIVDIVMFITDKNKKPQGGVVKGGIVSMFVKTSNSSSLPIYESATADHTFDEEQEYAKLEL
ncbi:Utp30p NDAI_0B05450 [Naumovozyma dairenensis CBS 421]|uniref:Ribosomal protein L1 n=1 Tax=Naumovozyma dairenensis (strain ATCC 10597 / BCRC 20456 / CBS 421 / NBRC 0211 / NRRL Y-12639) TaxID=1071378 RepID=G0W717_NAUDC|nr:hypothetical protein NDAI_0B05450 [Naumovozyma dairenensis CBS 421]CCD23578.1 hypothetical protein NDAI_0B05450 [Naumovozyma dairenensis CBS 421]